LISPQNGFGMANPLNMHNKQLIPQGAGNRLGMGLGGQATHPLQRFLGVTLG
jgi:hypothetical protein